MSQAAIEKIQQRRVTATFGLLETTQRLFNETLKKSTPRGYSDPNLKIGCRRVSTASTCRVPSNPNSPRVSPTASKSAISTSTGARRASANWYNIPLYYLDPSRESTLIAVQRQIKARDGILDSYRRVKEAFKQLQDGYVNSKEDINLIHRYNDMKRMIRRVSDKMISYQFVVIRFGITYQVIN